MTGLAVLGSLYFILFILYLLDIFFNLEEHKFILIGPFIGKGDSAFPKAKN